MLKVRFKLFIAPLFAFFFAVEGCHDYVPEEDDATPYIVNFTFSKPASTILAKDQYMPIEIRFDRNPSGYIHNVKVEVLDDKGVLLQKIFERNVHTFNSYTYNETNAYKSVTAGNFKLRASTTDETGKQENAKELNFKIQ